MFGHLESSDEYCSHFIRELHAAPVFAIQGLAGQGLDASGGAEEWQGVTQLALMIEGHPGSNTTSTLNSVLM